MSVRGEQQTSVWICRPMWLLDVDGRTALISSEQIAVPRKTSEVWFVAGCKIESTRSCVRKIDQSTSGVNGYTTSGEQTEDEQEDAHGIKGRNAFRMPSSNLPLRCVRPTEANLLRRQMRHQTKRG